jgi:DNA-binding IscR family transcriptional regulator
MRLQIGRRADLGLKVLRLLAGERRGWSAPQLATAVWTTPRFVEDALRCFEQRRWVTLATDGWQYAGSPDGPTLLDVIEAMEGPLRLDRCVLREDKPCGWVSGEPTCALHEAWLRIHVSISEQLTAIAAVPMAAAELPGIAAELPGMQLSTGRG